jgi:hypothetical protein
VDGQRVVRLGGGEQGRSQAVQHDGLAVRAADPRVDGQRLAVVGDGLRGPVQPLVDHREVGQRELFRLQAPTARAASRVR